MKNSSYLNWFRRLLVLGAVVAGATASAAGAAGNPAAGRNAAVPDVIERYAAAHPYGAASVPDVFERYAAAHPYGAASVPDVFERYAVVHPYGKGLLTPTTVTDRIVDDSFRDASKVTAPQANLGIVDDSFRDAARVTVPQSTGKGFDWGAVGIGAGAMLGLMMLVAGLGLGAVGLRHRSGRLGTS